MLRPPTVVGIASGATSFIVPAQFHVGPPSPDNTPHVLSKPPIFNVMLPPPAPVLTTPAKDVGNVSEVVLVLVLIIVIGHHVLVRVFDAAGRVIARAG